VRLQPLGHLSGAGRDKDIIQIDEELVWILAQLLCKIAATQRMLDVAETRGSAISERKTYLRRLSAATKVILHCAVALAKAASSLRRLVKTTKAASWPPSSYSVYQE
jgi:hypothetical protein